MTIVELKIEGDNIESDIIQAQILRLNSLTLRCFWKIISKNEDESSVLLERPHLIDDELFRLSVNTLGSEKIASFAVKELLPVLTANQLKEATQVVVENFERYKKEKRK